MKAEFLSALVLRKAGIWDNGKWKVDEPFSFRSVVAGQIFTVPKGFPTDLASVPRVPFLYELFGDTSDEAAALHDWLYTTHIVDRKTADAVLLEASKSTRVPMWRRYPMWAAVRLFGASHWGTRPRHLTTV